MKTPKSRSLCSRYYDGTTDTGSFAMGLFPLGFTSFTLAQKSPPKSRSLCSQYYDGTTDTGSFRSIACSNSSAIALPRET